jgi:hypothetical protein
VFLHSRVSVSDSSRHRKYVDEPRFGNKSRGCVCCCKAGDLVCPRPRSPLPAFRYPKVLINLNHVAHLPFKVSPSPTGTLRPTLCLTTRVTRLPPSLSHNAAHSNTPYKNINTFIWLVSSSRHIEFNNRVSALSHSRTWHDGHTSLLLDWPWQNAPHLWVVVWKLCHRAL